MFEQFTDRFHKVMALANQEAQRSNHEYIGTEHILLGLVKEGSGVGANVLRNLDVDLLKVRLEVEKLVKSEPETVTMGKLPITPETKKVIKYATEEARNLNHNYVGTEHLLLGLLREQKEETVARQVLVNLSLSLENVRAEVLSLLGVSEEDPIGKLEELAGEKLAKPEEVKIFKAQDPEKLEREYGDWTNSNQDITIISRKCYALADYHAINLFFRRDPK